MNDDFSANRDASPDNKGNRANDSRAPDWTLWRSFEAVITQGSLSGAAKQLGLSQPTLGRHIEALESSLAQPLFERHLRGLKPNAVALRIYEQVARANNALSEAALIATGANENLKGKVRLTASTVTSHYTLPGVLRQVHNEYPDIDIELVPSDTSANLLMRDADIAIRMYQPTQEGLIARKIAEVRLCAAAHHSYLEEKGTPESPQELIQHDLIGFDKIDLLIRAANEMGWAMTPDNFWLRTDSQTAIWEMAKAGLGITFAQEVLVNNTPGMVKILPQLNIPTLPVWLTTHKELHTNQHIRRVFDRLADCLKETYNKADPIF
ncbi:MAG: LysR family transcriptional regulator [Oceanobacter sp.]